MRAPWCFDLIKVNLILLLSIQDYIVCSFIQVQDFSANVNSKDPTTINYTKKKYRFLSFFPEFLAKVNGEPMSRSISKTLKLRLIRASKISVFLIPLSLLYKCSSSLRLRMNRVLRGGDHAHERGAKEETRNVTCASTHSRSVVCHTSGGSRDSQHLPSACHRWFRLTFYACSLCFLSWVNFVETNVSSCEEGTSASYVSKFCEFNCG